MKSITNNDNKNENIITTFYDAINEIHALYPINSMAGTCQNNAFSFLTVVPY